MCEYCHSTKCPAACPNYELKQVYTCDDCEEPIYEGDFYYDFGEFALCEECVQLHKRRAEEDDIKA